MNKKKKNQVLLRKLYTLIFTKPLNIIFAIYQKILPLHMILSGVVISIALALFFKNLFNSFNKTPSYILLYFTIFSLPAFSDVYPSSDIHPTFLTRFLETYENKGSRDMDNFVYGGIAAIALFISQIVNIDFYTAIGVIAFLTLTLRKKM